MRPDGHTLVTIVSIGLAVLILLARRLFAVRGAAVCQVGGLGWMPPALGSDNLESSSSRFDAPSMLTMVKLDVAVLERAYDAA